MKKPKIITPNTPNFSVSNQIADQILTSWDGTKCNRIQQMAGEWPNNERGMGGLNKAALVLIISEELKRII